jgi:hypothetical protein
MKYICRISSNSSTGREYEVETKSATKCAERFGRYEGGEVVTVYSRSGRVLSEVRYSPEDGGKYYRTEA